MSPSESPCPITCRMRSGSFVWRARLEDPQRGQVWTVVKHLCVMGVWSKNYSSNFFSTASRVHLLSLFHRSGAKLTIRAMMAP